MKIDKSDSLSANVNVVKNSTSSSNTTALKKSNVIEIDKTASVQNSGKERSYTMARNISQLNEYEKDTMPVSKRVVIDAIEKANRAISGGNRRFEFSIHEKTNEIMVKVFDSETDELIREIPNEKILDMVAKICEMVGILVDERR